MKCYSRKIEIAQKPTPTCCGRMITMAQQRGAGGWMQSVYKLLGTMPALLEVLAAFSLPSRGSELHLLCSKGWKQRRGVASFGSNASPVRSAHSMCMPFALPSAAPLHSQSICSSQKSVREVSCVALRAPSCHPRGTSGFSSQRCHLPGALAELCPGGTAQGKGCVRPPWGAFTKCLRSASCTSYLSGKTFAPPRHVCDASNQIQIISCRDSSAMHGREVDSSHKQGNHTEPICGLNCPKSGFPSLPAAPHLSEMNKPSLTEHPGNKTHT